MKRPRGFVLIVVLLMLAVVTAVALTQLDVVNSESISSLRAEEEVQARAFAESCLELLQTYADDYIGTSPNFLRPDFDGLLDRDTTTRDDDYLPSFGTRVVVPRLLSSSDSATVASHQWAFISRGTTNPGGCLVRIEDNSDDNFVTSAVPLGTTAIGEGPAPSPVGNDGRDVTNRDRDRSIVLTAIGLYPVRASDPAEAYERAHARVTLKRLYAVDNPPVFAPAIQSCDDVDIQSSSDVTGVGGIIAGDDGAPGSITVSGSSCGCGTYMAGTVTPSTPPPTCASCTGTPPSVATGAVPDCAPSTTMPTSTYYMENRGFGNPAANDNNIGSTSTCKIYIDRDGKTFVWDATDTYANDPAHPYPGYASALTAGGVPAAPVHNCTNYTKDPVELPCTWDTEGVAGSESITCNFTDPDPKLRQTPCWKPIALLGDENVMGSDVTLGVTPGPDLAAGIAGVQSEMSSDENDEDLLFLKNVPIPNVRDTTKRFATGSSATTMCGNPSGCEECTGTSNNDWWTECSKPSGATCEDFHAHAHQNNRHVPWPAIFAWDVAPGFDIEFEYEGAASAPMNVTILTNGNVEFKNDVAFCCAECGGPNSACEQPATTPGIPGGQKFIAAANCVEGNSQVPLPRTPPPPPPALPDYAPSGYGFAFKADGNCTITGVSTVVGDLECGALSLPGDPCLVGNVVATGGSTAVGCNSAPCNAGAPVGMCMAGSARLVNGNVYAEEGSVCTNSNTVITGDIYAGGNIELDSNTVVNGQVYAVGDVVLQSNSTVNYNGGSGPISAGNQGLTSFMEATW